MRLEKVQRKANRFIFGKHRRTDSPSLLMRENGINSLAGRRKMNRLLFLHKCFTGKVKLKLPNCVKTFSAGRTRHSQHAHLLTPIFTKTNAHRHSFFPRTVSEWNSLPPDVFQARDFGGELERLLHCHT